MIVVTGPTGNVGAELIRLLAAHDDQPDFRVISRHPQAVNEQFGEHISTALVDFDDRSTWDPALAGIKKLFLLYPLPHPRTVKTRMTPFVDAAVAAGCEHIVYVSVPGADHLKVVPHYGVERHIEASGAHHTFLRASYFMQNLVRAISTHGVDIADNSEIFIPAGNGKTSFVDSRDVAAVALDALLNSAKHLDAAYVLSGPERLHMDQAAEILSEVLGVHIRYAKPSMLQFWVRMKKRGMPLDVLFFMTIVYTLTRTGRNEPLTDTLPELLGRPATSFRQFAEDYHDRWLTRSWT